MSAPGRPRLALLLLALAGCGGGAPADAPPSRVEVDFRHAGGEAPGGRAAVRWTGDAVGQAELQRRLGEMSPALRQRYATAAERREWALSLARFELLAREALARGYASAPETVEAAKRAMVQRLVREQLQEAPAEVSEAELQAHYAKVRGDYVQPERVRLRHVFLAAPERGPARARALQRAEALAREARALPPGDLAAFGLLARTHSEEPRTRALDGDLRFLSLEALERDYGRPVAQAARGLTREGDVAGPVQTPAGVHVLKLVARQPPLSLSLEDVREALSAQLAADKRQAAYAAFLAGLERRYALEVDAAALEALRVDLAAPVLAPRGPPPGSVPAPSPRGSAP